LHIEYIVEPSEQEWTITYAGRNHGRFASRRDALIRALADLDHARRFGHDVMLTVRKPGGAARTILRSSPQPSIAP
jgi:hypothetical protein